MLYVFSSHCYCHPVIYSLSLFIIYSVNSFIANVICYITIPSLNKVLYLVSCILGYLIDDGIIKPDPERLRPLQELPPPSNARSLKRALGLYAYMSSRFLNSL